MIQSYALNYKLLNFCTYMCLETVRKVFSTHILGYISQFFPKLKRSLK